MSILTGKLTNTDHYLVVAKLRDRLLASKQESQQSVVDIFSLKNLNNVEGTEHYQIKISASICMTVGTSIHLGLVLENISKSWFKIIYVTTKGSSINQSVMKCPKFLH
jgi:hypothetical protein